VVGGDVGLLEDGRGLVLAGGHLVVAGLDRDAELEQLVLRLLHEGQDAVLDAAEVVVLQLLPLRRLGPHQRAPAATEVGPQRVERAVDEEVLLLRAHGGHHALRVVVAEEPEDGQRRSDRTSMERSSGVLLSSASPW
jgi:hypothetical protein